MQVNYQKKENMLKLITMVAHDQFIDYFKEKIELKN
jgi:hypothetical protein